MPTATQIATRSVLRNAAPRPAPRAPASPPSSLLVRGVDCAPADVFAALTALDTVTARFCTHDDPRAVFPGVYGVITRRVATAIREGGVFLEPAWVARLAGRFAERYFDALLPSLVGAAPASAAWRVAFDAGAGPRVPVRDAFLGINAHINFDLAQGIADNIAAAGHTWDARMLARYKHDHDAVNDILLAATPEIYTLLLERHACRATWLLTRNRHANRLVTRVTIGVIAGWRERVWEEMLTLLRGDHARRERELRAMDRRSGGIARLVAMTNPSWVAGLVTRRATNPTVPRGGVAGGLRPPAPRATNSYPARCSTPVRSG